MYEWPMGSLEKALLFCWVESLNFWVSLYSFVQGIDTTTLIWPEFGDIIIQKRLHSSSRQSRALFLPPASWHPTDKDKLV